MPTNQNTSVSSSVGTINKKLTPKRKKLISNVIYTIIMVLLGSLLAMLIWGRMANKITFIFDRAIVWILSESMEEQIPAQSYILVEKIDAADVKAGDVIVFYSDDPLLKGALNTHKVIEIIGDNEEFVTKGDNNLIQDKHTAKAEKVQGVYKTNLPFLTAIMRFIMSPMGFAVIIGILALIVVLPFFIPKKRNKANIDIAMEWQ